MDAPIEATRKITESNNGDFENNRGALRLTFSKADVSDSCLKHMCSDLFGAGIMKGQPTSLSFGLYDELSQEYPTDLAENATVKLGNNKDHIVIEIDNTLALA